MKASGRLTRTTRASSAGVALGEPLQHRQQQHRRPSSAAICAICPYCARKPLVVSCGVVVSSIALDDLADQPARAVGDPAGDLLEDPVADPLQGVGDRRGDRARTAPVTALQASPTGLPPPIARR